MLLPWPTLADQQLTLEKFRSSARAAVTAYLSKEMGVTPEEVVNQTIFVGEEGTDAVLNVGVRRLDCRISLGRSNPGMAWYVASVRCRAGLL
jgi:hypothetical protein